MEAALELVITPQYTATHHFGHVCVHSHNAYELLSTDTYVQTPPTASSWRNKSMPGDLKMLRPLRQFLSALLQPSTFPHTPKTYQTFAALSSRFEDLRSKSQRHHLLSAMSNQTRGTMDNRTSPKAGLKQTAFASLPTHISGASRRCSSFASRS